MSLGLCFRDGSAKANVTVSPYRVDLESYPAGYAPSETPTPDLPSAKLLSPCGLSAMSVSHLEELQAQNPSSGAVIQGFLVEFLECRSSRAHIRRSQALRRHPNASGHLIKGPGCCICNRLKRRRAPPCICDFQRFWNHAETSCTPRSLQASSSATLLGRRGK